MRLLHNSATRVDLNAQPAGVVALQQQKYAISQVKTTKAFRTLQRKLSQQNRALKAAKAFIKAVPETDTTAIIAEIEQALEYARV